MKEFVKIDEVKEGDTLIADAGLDCIQEGSKLVVYADSEGALYVKCNDGDGGRHYLEGQIGGPFGGFEPETHYVGFYKAP